MPEIPSSQQIPNIETIDNEKKQSFMFGNRTLLNDQDAFKHNAWDRVEWTTQDLENALEKVKIQKQSPVTEEMAMVYNADPAAYWNDFYAQHNNGFFKDRKWLKLEFPEIFESRDILEIGCGAGNTLFQITDPTRFCYGTDYSANAVQLVQNNPAYDEKLCRAFVWDVTSPIPVEIGLASLDIVICIFVLSALEPSTWAVAAENIFKLLKPGGLVLVRDYGRHDLAQLRFKSGRFLQDSFYVRGDGTRVFFFTNEDIQGIFSKFNIVQNEMDRRLLVNRLRKIKMHRCWVQAKFRKPLE